jgi:hypothetical protein
MDDTRALEPLGMTRSMNSVMSSSEETCSLEVRYAMLSAGTAVCDNAEEIMLTSKEEV